MPDHSLAKPLTDAADALIARVVALAGDGGDESKSNGGSEKSPVEGWSTYQVAYLLDGLFQRQELGTPQGRALLARVVGVAWGMAHNLNAEISYRWSLLVVKFCCVPCLPSVEAFLKRQGKQKFQVPIYRELHHSTGGGDAAVAQTMQAFARRVYAETKAGLHSNVCKYICKTMQWGGAE